MSPKNLLNHIHKGQKRRNGDNYISHPNSVKKILEHEGIKETYILNAALLHDIIEDSKITKEYLALRFGNKVANIVELLSKSKAWCTPYCAMKHSLDNMEEAWIRHPEAILIKVADRLHNLKTIQGLSHVKRIDFINETEELLIPFFEKIISINSLNDMNKYIINLIKKIKKEIASIKKKRII